MEKENIVEQEEISYKEVFCKSFPEAVGKIGDTSLEKEGFCLVDIDGTLIVDPLVKMPFMSHLVDTGIPLDIQESFTRLVSKFGVENIALITNRNERERVFWNSHKVLESTRELLERNGIVDSLYTGLNKQLPRLFSRRCDGLLEKMNASLNKVERMKLFCIEDFSYVSLNRNDFLILLAKRIKNELGKEVDVVNYVVRM